MPFWKLFLGEDTIGNKYDVIDKARVAVVSRKIISPDNGEYSSF